MSAHRPPNRFPARGALLRRISTLALMVALAGGHAYAAGSLPTATNLGNWANASAATAGSSETVTVTANRAYAEWNAFNLSSGKTFAVSG